ncbi:MAG: arpA protein [Pseudomonadota bacterium]
MALDGIVDAARYPIHDVDGPGFEAAVAEARAGLADDGCSILKGFVLPEAAANMAAEGERLRDRTIPVERDFWPYPPYQRVSDGDWPAGHPRRRQSLRRNRFVGYDWLDGQSLTRQLYETPAMTEFVRRVAGVDVLYPYADPLGACALSIQEAGEALPWHFDVTHFVVSLLVHEPEEGGRFQYASYLRSDDNENYDDVTAVLDGTSDRVVDLDMKPGDLQFFEGRHSMHRVTAPAPGTWRCIALLSYCDKPGVIGSKETQRHLYGRVNREPLLKIAG